MTQYLSLVVLMLALIVSICGYSSFNTLKSNYDDLREMYQSSKDPIITEVLDTHKDFLSIIRAREYTIPYINRRRYHGYYDASGYQEQKSNNYFNSPIDVNLDIDIIIIGLPISTIEYVS